MCDRFSYFLLSFIAKTCIGYIKGWIYHFDEVLPFNWITLRQPVVRADVQALGQYMASKNKYDMASRDVDLFEEYSYLKEYQSKEKIDEWNAKETLTDQRWVECFKHLSEKNVPYKEILCLVSYVLCLPGTSASVERLFSLINDMWSPDKSRLLMETLLHMLYVRYNINMKCLEFYNFLKEQPRMCAKSLRKRNTRLNQNK